MKIIDILNAKANGTLEDGFKFKYNDGIYIYTKKSNRIISKLNYDIGDDYKIERCLNDEVEVISNEIDIDSIEELDTEISYGDENYNHCWINNEKYLVNKINELAQAVKQLNKKLEDK